MKKLMIAAVTVAFTAGGIALPVAASASTHHHATHHAKQHSIKHAPCTGLGIDIALGSTNICIPL